MTNTEPTKSKKTKNPKYKVSYHRDGALHVFYEEQPHGDAKKYCFTEIDQSGIKSDRWSVVKHIPTGAYWETEKKIVNLFAGEYGSYYWDEVDTGEDFCEVVAAIEDGSAFIE